VRRVLPPLRGRRAAPDVADRGLPLRQRRRTRQRPLGRGGLGRSPGRRARVRRRHADRPVAQPLPRRLRHLAPRVGYHRDDPERWARHRRHQPDRHGHGAPPTSRPGHRLAQPAAPPRWVRATRRRYGGRPEARRCVRSRSRPAQHVGPGEHHTRIGHPSARRISAARLGTAKWNGTRTTDERHELPRRRRGLARRAARAEGGDMSRVGRRGLGLGSLLAMCVLAIPWRVQAWDVSDDVEFRANYRGENYLRLPGGTTTTYIDPFTSKQMTERNDVVMSQRNELRLDLEATLHTERLWEWLGRTRFVLQMRPWVDSAFYFDDNGQSAHRRELTPYWSNNISAIGGYQGGQNAVLRNNADPLFREYYLDIAPENFFFRIGRQIIPWGKSDGVYMLDVINPFDLRNPTIFEEENFKIPVWAANLNWKPTTDSNLQVLYIPKYLSNVWGGINVNRAGQSIESRFHDWTYQIVGFFN